MFNIFKKPSVETEHPVSKSQTELDDSFYNACRERMNRYSEIDKAEMIVKSLHQYKRAGDKSLEAKHWQILAEYASDQVKELSGPISEKHSHPIELSKEEADELLKLYGRPKDTQFGQTKVVGCKGKGCNCN